MTELQRFIELKQFELGIINSERTIFELEDSEIAHLQTYILDIPERTSVSVQELLNNNYDGGYKWRVLPEDIEQLQRGNIDDLPANNSSAIIPNIVTVYPNPANEVVHFSFSELENNNARIQITNLYGAVVQEIAVTNGTTNVQWNTETNSEGIYFYHLLGGDKVLETNRILLIK